MIKNNWNTIIEHFNELYLKEVGVVDKTKNVKNQSKDIKITPTLDLHGFTKVESIKQIKSFIKYNYTGQIKIITGKSGDLFKLLPIWCNNELKSQVKSFKKEKTGGSYILLLNK